jgi:Domain of unknown function (DUF4272)
MTTKDAVDVARRCLCLELLLQRLGLETDTEDSVEEREGVRRMWLSRLGDLSLESVLVPGERALLERAVGEMSEDELDDLHGRASGAVVLLWALGRLPARPTFAAVSDMESVVGEHGLLGAGSITRANETVASATLRPEAELREALAAYGRTRGKAREPSEPEKIVAGVAAHHLDWILDREMTFDVAD